MARTPALIALVCLASAGCSRSGRPDAGNLVVPDRLGIVVPQLVDPEEALSDRLIYEANNPLMRTGLRDGGAIAARWRRVAERSSALFVLRDSLWAQQDHPTRNAPMSLMLPPSWIAVAATRPESAPVDSFAPQDDRAWSGVKDRSDLFGGYPASQSLYRFATANLQDARGKSRDRIRFARESISQLSRMTETLHRAGPHGWRAVITAGAELIARGDRDYFSPTIRREHIIPIFVENPNPHEIEEGKGYVVPGMDLSRRVRLFLVGEICRQRLRDGDIALERYDLSSSRDVKRALDILTRIIPDGDPGNTRVWLWVTGRLEPGLVLKGEGALEYAEDFWRRAADLPIDLARLKLFSKPWESIGPHFERLLGAYRGASLYFSVDVGVRSLLASVARSPTR